MNDSVFMCVMDRPGQGFDKLSGAARDSQSAIGDLQSVIPKITDFGLAKHVHVDASQTQSGVIVGTPRYMAPEQAAGRSSQVGPATDVHALGAILYELLTGRPPFGAATTYETLQLILGEEPVAPTRFNPKLFRDLETICLKCLQKDACQRYGSAAALADDLQRFLAGEPVRARPVGRSARLWRWCRRNPTVATLTAAVATLLVAVAAASLVAAYRFSALADRERAALAEAEARAEEIRQGIERHNRAYRLLESGQLHVSRGQWSRALADYKQAIALQPDNPLVWVARGYLFARLALWDQAAGDFARSFEKHRSNEASIWSSHAALRCYVGDTDGYRQVCARMADHFGPATDDHTGWYVAEACTLAPNDVDPDRLIRLAEEAVGSDPQRPSYLITLGAVHYRAGRFKQAIQRLHEALRADNGWIESEAWPFLAMAHHRLGQHAEARHWLDKTRRGLDHLTLKHTYDLFGDAPFWTNKFDRLSVYLLHQEAEALMGVLPRTDHPLRWLLHCRGHMLLGRLDLAAATFAQALELQPGEWRLWFARGRYFGRLGQWDQAAADFAQLITLQPPELQIVDWCFHAGLRLRVGDHAGYRQVCKQLLERSSKTIAPLDAHRIALVSSLAPAAVADRGRLARLAELALGSEPQSGWYLFTRGAVAYRAGQFEQAAGYCRQALKVHWPDSGWNESGIALARLFLSLACHRLGHGAEARRELHQAVRAMDQAVGRTAVGDLDWAYSFWMMCQILRREVEALQAGKETGSAKAASE